MFVYKKTLQFDRYFFISYYYNKDKYQKKTIHIFKKKSMLS